MVGKYNGKNMKQWITKLENWEISVQLVIFIVLLIPSEDPACGMDSGCGCPPTYTSLERLSHTCAETYLTDQQFSTCGSPKTIGKYTSVHHDS